MDYNGFYFLMFNVYIAVSMLNTGSVKPTTVKEVDKYGTLILGCRIDAAVDDKVFAWKNNNFTMHFSDGDPSSSYKLVTGNGRYDLQIKGDERISGFYQCIRKVNGTPEVLSSYIVKVRTSVTEKDMSVSGSKEICQKFGIQNVSSCVEVQEYSNLTIWCNTTAYPEPTVEWFLGGMQLHIMGRALKIFNVTRQCGGKFTCRALNEKNKGVPVNQTIKVIIKYPQNMSTWTKDVFDDP